MHSNTFYVGVFFNTIRKKEILTCMFEFDNLKCIVDSIIDFCSNINLKEGIIADENNCYLLFENINSIREAVITNNFSKLINIERKINNSFEIEYNVVNVESILYPFTKLKNAEVITFNNNLLSRLILIAKKNKKYYIGYVDHISNKTYKCIELIDITKNICKKKLSDLLE